MNNKIVLQIRKKPFFEQGWQGQVYTTIYYSNSFLIRKCIPIKAYFEVGHLFLYEGLMFRVGEVVYDYAKKCFYYLTDVVVNKELFGKIYKQDEIHFCENENSREYDDVHEGDEEWMDSPEEEL